MIINYIEYITEHVNDYSLYHFTDIDSLKDILKDESLYPMYDKISGQGISTTRYKDFKWSGNEVTIIFDKSKVKTRYKIKPVHWFNMSHNWQGGDDYRQYGHDARPRTKQDIPANQYEERIVSENPIPVSFIDRIVLNKKLPKKLTDRLKELEIPFSYS